MRYICRRAVIACDAEANSRNWRATLHVRSNVESTAGEDCDAIWAQKVASTNGKEIQMAASGLLSTNPPRVAFGPINAVVILGTPLRIHFAATSGQQHLPQEGLLEYSKREALAGARVITANAMLTRNMRATSLWRASHHRRFLNLE